MAKLHLFVLFFTFYLGFVVRARSADICDINKVLKTTAPIYPGDTVQFSIYLSFENNQADAPYTVTDNMAYCFNVTDLGCLTFPAGSASINASISAKVYQVLLQSTSKIYTAVCNVSCILSTTQTPTNQSNVAQVTGPATGANANAACKVAQSGSTSFSILRFPSNLAITKSGTTSVSVGGQVIYTIQVSNYGSKALPAGLVTVIDTLPTGLSSKSWNCSSSGSTCPASSGSGDISAILNSFAVGDVVNFTITATVSSTLSGQTIINTANFTVSASIDDTDLTNNAGTASTTITPLPVVSISKSDNITLAVAGLTQPIYTIIAYYTGPTLGSPTFTITDLFDSTYFSGVSWTCTGYTTGVCASANGTSLNLTQIVTLPPSGSVIYRITTTLKSSVFGIIQNTAKIVGATSLSASFTDNTTVVGITDLRIAKDDKVSSLIPGNLVTYTVGVYNTGPSDAIKTTITDTFSSSLTGISWSCSNFSKSVCPSPSGTTSITQHPIIFAGGSVAFIITATVAPGSTGFLINIANATTSTTDSLSSNNGAVDSDTLNPTVDLRLTKVDTGVVVNAGSYITYSVQVANYGPSNAPSLCVVDTFSSLLYNVQWRCYASGAGAACNTSLSTGNIVDTTVAIPVNTSVLYVAVAQVLSTVPANSTITNWASVFAPSGVTSPIKTDDLSKTVTTIKTTIDLSITKSDSGSTSTPGSKVTYTIKAMNNGPSDAAVVSVLDTFSSLVKNVKWACTGTGSGVCNSPSGFNSIALYNVKLPAGGTVTFVATADIYSSSRGILNNIASVKSISATDSKATNNYQLDSNTLVPGAAVSVTKSDAKTLIVAGVTTILTYTINVTNLGPSDLERGSVSIVDTFDSKFIKSVSWSCSPLSYCGVTTPSTLQPLKDTNFTLPFGESITYQVIADLYSSVAGTLTNNAVVRIYGGVSELSNATNTGTDTTTVQTIADVRIHKTDGFNSTVPGTPVTYWIGVYNTGPSDAIYTTITDTFSGQLSDILWTCTAFSNAFCASAGPSSGPINAKTKLFAGGSVAYKITANIQASATGTLTNTANASVAITQDSAPSNNMCVDSTALGPEADLQIQKTDGRSGTPVVAGNSITYSIRVINYGPSDGHLGSVCVVDSFSSALFGIAWTCSPTGSSAGCSPLGTNVINDTAVNLPLRTSILYVITARTYPSVVSIITNWASVFTYNAVKAGSDISKTQTQVTTNADLVVTKTDGKNTTIPGTLLTYTITVFNQGPSDSLDVTVVDSFSSQLESISWTCNTTGRAQCSQSMMSGNIFSSTFIGFSSYVTFKVTAKLRTSTSGYLTNKVNAISATTSDSNINNNYATDVNLITLKYDLSISKSDNKGVATPGTAVTYSITVDNYGPSDAPIGSFTVVDLFNKLQMFAVSWSCTPYSGATCTLNGATDILDSSVAIPANAKVLYIATAWIYSSLRSSLINNASVTTDISLDSLPLNNEISDLDIITPQAAIDVTKFDLVQPRTTSVPGTYITYHLIVRNLGPSDSSNINVTDVFSSYHYGITWTCSAYRASCGSSNSSGVLRDSPYLAVGGSLLYELVSKIYSSAVGSLSNSVTISPVYFDAIATDNIATDVNILTPVADVKISKTDQLQFATPGILLTYSVTIANNGPSDALVDTVSVLDVFPSILKNTTWTCQPTPNSHCSGGNNTVLTDRPVIRAGGTVVYLITGKLQSDVEGNITNKAAVTVWDTGSGIVDSNTDNNYATDTDVLLPLIDLVVTKTDNVPNAVPGLKVTYTIDLVNQGPSDGLLGRIQVSDYLSQICAADWTCTALTPTAACSVYSGNLTILDQPTLLVGDSVRYILTTTICPDAIGSLINTVYANVTTGNTDTTPAVATDTDTLIPVVDVSITKNDNLNVSAGGAASTYTIVVQNFGPSDIPASRITITDIFSGYFSTWSWGCTATTGSSCTTGPQSNTDIVDSPHLLANGKLIYTVNAVTRPNIGSVMLINTVTATLGPSGGSPNQVYDSNLANNIGTDNTTIIPSIDLSVVKFDNKLIVSPEETINYSIVLTNNGPSDALSFAVQIIDLFNQKFESYNWACMSAGGATCLGTTSGVNVPINTTYLYLKAHSNAYITVTAKIAVLQVGALDNTASLFLLFGGADPILTNNYQLDRDGLNSTSNIGVTLDDNTITAIPGRTVTYTVIAGNTGPARIDPGLVSFTDNFPSTITQVTWTCQAIPATPIAPSCGTQTSGSGLTFGHYTSSLPARTSIKFIITAQISSAATGSLVYSVISTLFFSITDPDLNDNSATDTDTLLPQADITVTKAVGGGSVIPGQANTYTITVANNGPSDTPSVTLTDPFPAPQLSNVQSGSCIAVSPSSCTTTDITAAGLTALANIKAGSNVQYVIVYLVAALIDDDPNCGIPKCILNTATANILGGIVTTLNPSDDVSAFKAPINRVTKYTVTKSGPTNIPLAGDFTYTIIVKNSGPSQYRANFIDNMDSIIVPDDGSLAWTCKGSGGAVCGTFDSSASSFSDSSFVLPVTGQLTYTLVTSLATQQSDRLLISNVASVQTDTDQALVWGRSDIYTNGGIFNIDVSKSASSSSVFPGSKITWTIVVTRNSGQAETTTVLLTDSVPGACSSPTWTCTGTKCGRTSGSGSLSKEPISMVDGDTVTYKVTCTGYNAGSITNTASIRLSGFNKGTSSSSATVTVAGVCPHPCSDGTCATTASGCPSIATGDGATTQFDDSGGFTLSAGDTKLILSLGDIKELDSEGRVIYAENLQEQDYNVTSVAAISYTGKDITNVNFTATLQNGAFFRIAYYIFTQPDIYPIGSVKLEISGATNKFSIIVADWPFEDFDVHSFQIDIGFDTGGELVNDPCLSESSSGDKRITTSQFQTDDGIVAVQVLQFATLDGVETTVSAEILEDKLVLTTACFFIDMIYDPDFSVLLGGSASTGGCANTAQQAALLRASYGALSGAFGFAALVIGFYVFWDKRKKYLRKAARNKAQEAYHTGARPSGSGTGSVNTSW